ncbi:hypothetical protein VN24_03550 [Paenibacillus beijingensis]|uniref:Type II secretion system protein GspF domain-containing protein n=1 Tax=Paenibacillus beijingensis TaxID=1126833 RepID=A0A0D5NQL2_9BACL|nr:hypothetical protein VN24_03550 [Paenibacillus beijingensis]
MFALSLAAQYLFGLIAASALLRLLPRRRPRWMHLTAVQWQSRSVPDRWLARLALSREHPVLTERQALLAGCGFTGDAALYVLTRRLLLIFIPLLLLAAPALFHFFGYGPQLSFVWYLFPLALCIGLIWDKPSLQYVRRIRSQRITKEIYIISSQLLYLSGSSLNVHTKLMRCVPYAKTIRGDMQRMLGEWYHDAEGALRKFKLRLGTEEGLSFVETIDSLRLHEDEAYYTLLRERIQDYKEKLELIKESRKESSSYLLFVLAGIPILYTFQIFIYPWVREGQRLFDSLN